MWSDAWKTQQMILAYQNDQWWNGKKRQVSGARDIAQWQRPPGTSTRSQVQLQVQKWNKTKTTKIKQVSNAKFSSIKEKYGGYKKYKTPMKHLQMSKKRRNNSIALSP